MRRKRGDHRVGEEDGGGSGPGGGGSSSSCLKPAQVNCERPSEPDAVFWQGDLGGKHHLDPWDPSMSAAVQELYPGPPGALSTDQTALSDQAILLDVDPETSAFALPCGSGLPSEHQRTYEGKICYQDSDEKLDCTSKASCPRLMELLPKEPAEAGGLAEDDKAQSSSTMEQNSLHRHLREAAETAKDMRGIAEECLVPVFLSSKETCWPTEKVLWPIQEGGEFLSRPPCVEIAGSLQSLEESQANVQVTTESLPSPMNEAQGMKADGPRLFSKAGESRTRGSPGVSPESSECSAVDTVTAKAEVSETDTLVSLEPVKAMDSALAKAQLPDEEDCEGLTTCSASTTTTDVLSGSEAGGEKILNQETEVNAILDHCLPSQRDEVDLHGISRSDSGLESRVSVDALLSDTDCDASDCLLQGSLEFGNMLWAEITDIFEVVCEMQEDLPAGEEKNLRSGASCEQIQLLEEWASTANIEGRLSPARLNGEGSSDDEQEVRDCMDHSYSCVSEGTVETEKGDAVQYSWEETQGSFHSVKQELQICPSAKEKSVHSENGTFCLLDLVAHSSSEEYAEVDLRSAPSRIDNIQKDDQLCILPCIGSLATVGEENTPLLVDVDHFECFQDNCSTNINSIPTHYGTLNCRTRLCEGLLLLVKSNSDPGAEMGASTPRLHVTSSSSPADMDLVTDKGSPQTIQPSGACSFSQQADAVLSSSGLLDSPPGEEFSGSCFKEERQSFACQKEFSPANQNGGSCRETSQHSTALMPSDAEKRMAEKTVAESNTCCPSGLCMGGLCCAARTCCSISKQVGIEGHVLETRTGTDTPQVDGLGMRQASSSPKIVGPSQGCEGVEEHRCLPHENGGGDLGGAESTLGSIGSVGVSSTGLSEAEGLESWAEAGSQRTDDHCVKAEETQDVELTHVYPPDTNPEQERIKMSLREGPSYMETMESEEMQEESCRNGVSEKLGGDKNVDITLQPLELGRFREVQDKEELERFQAPSSSCSSSSSPSVLSDLRTGLNSASLDLTQQQGYSSHLEYLCSKDPGQLWEALCQRKIQAHAQQNCYLHSQASFNQKNETLEAEGLECQQHPLVISEKQKEECTVEAAETQKCTSCNQKEWLCPARDGDGTPPAPGLLTENSAEETFQQNASNCSSNKIELQPVGSPSKGGLKHTTPPSECSEHVSRLLTLSGFSKQQADDMETDASGSASLSVSGSLSDGLEKKNSPKFNYEPASPPSNDCFHSDPLTLTTDNSQKSTEGVCSKSCRSKEISSSIYIPLEVQPAQNPGSGSSQKDEPSASPLLNVLCSPPAKKPCAVIGSFEREADDGARPLASENEKAICSVKGFAPLHKAVPTSMVDSKAGVEIIRQTVSVTSSSMDSATKIRQPVEDDQREISLTAETKNLPVRSLPNTEDSSGFLLQDLKLPLGGEEIPVPSKAEVHAQPSFVHSLEGPSELGLRKEQSFVNCPSKQAVVTWISEDMGHALHSQDLFPVRAPDNLCSTVPFASLGGSMPEASPKCTSSKGRSWQDTDNDQELAGDCKKPSEYSVNKGIEVPVKDTQASETEACPTLNKKPIQEEADRSPDHRVVSCNVIGQEQRAKEKVNQRILRIELPLHGTPLKPEIAIRQTFAVGRVIEGSKNKNPCGTLRDSKRPKRSRGLSGLEYMEAKASEARSPSLSFRNCSQPSTDSSTPLVPAFCTFLQAFNLGHNGIRRTAESARKIRLSSLFRRPPGKVCRSSMPGWIKATRKVARMRSATPLKHSSEVVPMHNNKLAGSASFARQMAATENKGAAIWDPMPKQRAGQSSWSSPSRLSERTKDSAVLKGLSVLANKLLPPEGTLQKPKPLVCSTQFLPLTEKCSQLRSQKLLEVFSCINRKLNSPWANGSRCGTQASSSQSLALYPVESTSLCVLELRHRTPFSCNAPFLPVSFHIKMGPPMPTKNLMGIAPLQGVPDKLALGEAHWAWPPSKWTFSFLLPPSCLGIAPIQEGAWLPPESSTAPVPLSAAKGRERSAIAQRSVGFPVLGLQTVLALSSPGCYRFWMRKRNLASRIPAIQKLALLQFTQGLKGLKCSASVSADLFSPLPYSLGRVLSIWSQHGPATCPSEFTLHSNRCKWQPITAAATRLGLGNRTYIVGSSAMWPQVPDQVIGAPRAVNDDIRLEPSFSASLPTSCSIPGPALSALGLLAPELQVHRLDELDVSVPVLPKTGTCLEKAEPEKRPKKVSQIRIRKTIPKPDPNLTPMGLPRPKRLKKTEFSLEEIYTNKNYKSPPTTRCLETIFEEPKERNGSLISVSQQKRKRILEFQDFTVPRKRKARSRVKVMGSSTRAQKAALEGRELDVLLIQKLTDLEAFFAKEEWEQTPGS